MRKRWRPGLIVVVALLIGWFAFYWSRPQEPTYQGRQLSLWLNDYLIISYGNSLQEGLIAETNQVVDMIVRQIGTNAIPALLRMLGAKDSPVRKLAYLANEHGLYDWKFTSNPALVQNIHAALAFRALGADASNAVPRLIAMLDQSRPEGSQDLIAWALGGIGPPASNAVPSLLKTVTNGSPTQAPQNALRALGEIHALPQMVVPVLIKFLKHPDVNTRRRSIRNLQAFGAAARPAVTALVEALTDQDAYVRKYAAEAIRTIDPEAAAKAGVK